MYLRSSRDESDGMLVEPQNMAEPIRGAVSDDENNDDSYWPEFEEPEPENDPDFTVLVHLWSRKRTVFGPFL